MISTLLASCSKKRIRNRSSRSRVMRLFPRLISVDLDLTAVNFNGVSRRLGANQEPIYISSESPRTHLSIAVKIFPIRESYNDIQEEFWNHAQGEDRTNIPGGDLDRALLIL
ncbi:unnamed protein product [Microthlaspi erraticum]|uniref:Uncharacterized protein n=1 Tax=Microthlaspi erraticum TaxID=1685480 RepID=A0A6D2KRI9_9BRAS|nr:unnamed protein product [Microthlaspi erraticum]